MTAGGQPVRVVVADDHPMFRFGLLAALAGAEEVEVVGEAGDGRELLAVVDRTLPDVVLTDLAMAGMDATAATAVDGTLRVTVTDDGGGIGEPTDGVGLGSMRRRAETLGGRLEIDSSGTGTAVTAFLPLEPVTTGPMRGS